MLLPEICMRIRLAAMAIAATFCATVQAAQQTAPSTDEEIALYAAGYILSVQITEFEFTDAELALVTAGLEDGVRNRLKVDAKTMQAQIPRLQELQRRRKVEAAAREGIAGTAYMASAAAEPGAIRLASGVIYRITREGTGATPDATDIVTVRMLGKYVDGKVFDESASGDKPVSVILDKTIPCFQEGVQHMKAGSKAQLVCPPDLAYGDSVKAGGVRPNATLVFDVELLEIEKP
jgi:FKBP-type peptidyl-prolyl cis-trans isomerase FkpA